MTQHAARPADSEISESPTRRMARSETAVSRHAVILGLVLVPLNVYWVIVAELRWYVVLTLNPLFVTPIFYLFLLVGLNSALKRMMPRFALKRADLIVIYIMLVMSCTIATHDFIINLMSTMGWARWFATPENAWETRIFPHLPRWLLVWDRDVLAGYMNGNANLYDVSVLRAWLVPLSLWSVFIFALGWMFLCLTALLRKAWMDETRLSFPIVRLPLAMTEEAGLSWNSKALWIGFAVATALSLLNGLHEYYPNLPHFQVRARWLRFTSPPWNAVTFPITFYPFAVGLAYLVPLDVSFSCWFFYLFMKLQKVMGAQFGLGNVPDMPFEKEQAIGAWYTFGVYLLYTNRHYIRRIVRVGLGREEAADAGEPMSYRTAFWGLVAGMAVFFVFWWSAGMSPVWVLVVMVTYIILALCITRVRAEAGGQHTVWDLEPMNLFRLFDSRALGPANLALAAVSHWYWRLNRSHTMPSQLEAFKLAQEHKINLRSLVMPMLAAFGLATIAGMWSCLHVFYREGALAKCQGFAIWTGWESYNWLTVATSQGFRMEGARWGVTGGAVIFTVFLSWMRARFPSFPFHPLGYCIGPGLLWLWFPFFIAWLVKLLILRYGGLKFYLKSMPFFLGLVLGDYVMGAMWSLIGVTWHIPSYQIFH